MYTVITKFTRQDADTPYYLDHAVEIAPLFHDFTRQHGSLIIDLIKFDVTDLIQINYAVYQDEDNFNQFMALFNQTFPTFFTDRDLYCQNNNIQIERTVEEN